MPKKIIDDMDIVEVDMYGKLPKYIRWYYRLCDFIFDITPPFLYQFYHNWLTFRSWYYRIKHFMQRIYRGFDDTETYSLDYSLYIWLLPRLIRFRALNNGHPYQVYKSYNEFDNELKKRIKQLEFIIQYAFELEVVDEYDKAREDFNNWLAKNINHLWW